MENALRPVFQLPVENLVVGQERSEENWKQKLVAAAKEKKFCGPEAV